jgi:WD40 repeat protein
MAVQEDGNKGKLRMKNEQLARNNKKRSMNISMRMITAFFFLYGISLNATAQEVAVFPQLGHDSFVYSVAFNPDGRQALSGSSDATVKLWDVATGKEIRTFLGHSSIVYSVAFSPDGRQVLSGSEDNTVKQWDAATGREIRTFSGHLSFVTSVTFSPDGRQVLSGSWDNTVKLWETATGREIRTFSGHSRGVKSVTFSPDGRQVLSGSLDNTVKLWDTTTGMEIRTFSGHSDIVTSVAFSPDGRQVLSGSWDNTVKLWDAATGREIRTFSWHSSPVRTVAFSPDGRRVLSSSDYSVILWDAATGREIRTFSGHSHGVNSVAFSPDGRQALFGSGDNTIKLWDVATGKEIRTFSGHSSIVYSVAFSPDGGQVLSGSEDNTVKLWDAAMGREIRTFSGHSYSVSSVAFNPDGRQVLSGSADNTIKLWDAATGREIRTFSGHSGGVISVAFSPDGRQVLSSSWDNTVKLWDAATGREIRTFSEFSSSVSSIAFSPDGRQVLSDSGDNTVKLWDAATGREIRTFSGHSSGVISVAFSSDGRQVLSGSRDNTIKLWDAATGKEIRTVSGFSSSVSFITFSPDGRRVLSGSRDNTIKLWDAATGREIRTFSGHSGDVESVAFSPDGRQVLSGSRDSTFRLWEISSGKEIVQFISFNDGEWLVFSPDGYYNSSPNGDKYLNIRVGNYVYGIAQYRNTFYRPQIVEARLQGRPDPVNVVTTIQEAASFDPPIVVIRSPENGVGLSSNQVELSVSVVDQKQPVKTIKVMVNGRLVGGETMRGRINSVRGELELENTQIRLNGNQNRVEFKLPITLDSGINRIEVLADNPFSEGRDSVEVNYNQAAVQQNILPNLWILSIGINRYDSPLLQNLDYAVNDAREIINVFKVQEGRLYRKVNSLLIADGTAVLPTRENILDNFSFFLKQAGQRDVVMLFIAGHGQNDENGNFFFMPSDAVFTDDGSIRPSRAVSYRDIQSVLDVPGQKLVFIDACHSEGVSGKKIRGMDNNQLVRTLQDNSTVIFTASRGSERSQESKGLNHGVFTYALIQGMKGEADLFKKGKITMKELDTYVSEMVPKLTNGAQHPTTNTPDGYINFVVAELK